MPEAVSQASTAIKEAERLIQAGSLESASELLEHVIEHDATVEARYLLAATYCELGDYDAALRNASAAVDQDPSSAPARDMLAKVNLALGHYDSALTDYIGLAALCREQSPKPPDQCSIPAHYALHNIEQLEHILTVAKRENPTSGGVLPEGIKMFIGSLRKSTVRLEPSEWSMALLTISVTQYCQMSITFGERPSSKGNTAVYHTRSSSNPGSIVKQNPT